MNIGEIYLEARGITPSTIRDQGIEIDAPPLVERVVERLHRDILLDGVPISQLAEAIVWFGIKGVDGKVLSYIARPLRTKEVNGGPKFLTPVGGTAPPFIVPAVRAVQKDISVPLTLSEGPVKALAVLQAGGFSAGLSGVWMGGSKTEDDKYILRPELGAFQLSGRKVNLSFDADFRRNAEVRHAMIRQAFLLSIHGADVYQLTTWSEEDGKGIDDYLVLKAGLDDGIRRAVFEALVTRAQPFFQTIAPTDLPFIETELVKVCMSELARMQLCKRLAKPLGVSVEALWNVGRKKDSTARGAGAPPSDPAPWPGEVNGEDLLDEIYGLYTQHAVISEAGRVALTLWTVMTFFTDHLNWMPMIYFHSHVEECGKTRVTEIMNKLCHNPKMAGNMSDAAVYHEIERSHPTLFLSEFEDIEKRRPELVLLLNASCARSEAFVTRYDVDLKDNKDFCTFGPKTFSSIKPIPRTLQSRCITIEMERRKDGEEILSFRKARPGCFEECKAKIIRWGNSILDDIRAFEAPDLDHFTDRQIDNWEPELSFAAAAGQRWYERTLKCAAELAAAASKARARSPEMYLLWCVWRAFKEKGFYKDADFISSVDLHKSANADQEAPWADWNGGRGLSVEKFATLLRGFNEGDGKGGIKSTRPKGGPNRDIRGFYLNQFRDAFQRYLKTSGPPPPPPENPTQPEGQPAREDKGSGAYSTSGNPAHPAHSAQSDQISSEATAKTVSFVGNPDQGNLAQTSLFPREGPCGNHEMGPVGRVGRVIADIPPSFPVESNRKIDLAEKGSCVVLYTPQHVAAYSAVLSAETIALDIETWASADAKTERKFLRKGGAKKACPSLDWQVAHIRLISLYVPGADHPVVIDLGVDPSSDMRREVSALLEKISSIETLGHNLSFDLTFLGNEFGFNPKKVWDTCAAVKLLENDDHVEIHAVDGGHYDHDPRDYHAGLGAALYHYAGIDIDKGLGGGGNSGFGAELLSDEQYVYSGNDARYIPTLVEHLKLEITLADMDAVAALEFDLIPWSARAELTGVPTDAPAMDVAIGKRVEALKVVEAHVEEEMKGSGFDTAPFYQQKRKRDPLKFNANSTLLKQAFFTGRLDEEGAVITLPPTLKGNPSFTEEALKEVKHPVARAYLEYDRLCSEILTLRQRRKHVWDTDAVHPTFNLLGANTGRITVSDPAMQNVPTDSESRGMYKAPPGMVFVQGDLSRIELRAQAQFSGDSAMIAAFNLPKSDPLGDLYAITGSKIFVLPLEEVAGNDKHPAYKLGKRVNLAFCYGMQAQEFQNRTRDSAGEPYTLEEAIAFRQAYFDLYPGMAAWIEGAWEATRTGRVIEGRTKLGRRRIILPTTPGTRNTRAWREFQAQINYLVQGSCADGLKIAIGRILARLPIGAVIILSVHDELLILCKEEDGAAVAAIANEEMTEAYRIAFGGELLVRIEFNAKPIKSWAEK
jgi:hypothetical protein